MSRVAWFHCFSGIAGDMALGALLDAGADEAAVRDLLGKLSVPGWTLEVTNVQRAGVRATRADVRCEETHVHRRLPQIHEIVRGAGLPVEVRERALAVFDRLATAEARLHGAAVDDVELHEVGSVDAIVDVVGVCAALHLLGVDRVQCSPVAQGTGMTSGGSHGELPVPAPATMALLTGIPTYGLDVGMELTTPTGAALVSTLATGFGPLPALTTTAVGYGAGGRDLPRRPNVVQVVIGEAEADDTLGRGLAAVLLEVNVDDATGEMLAHTIAQLLDAGAHDAWVTPVVMKKGRPAHTVHVLCDPALASPIADVLTRESGSLGVRGTRLERWPHARDEALVDIDGQPVRVKLGAGRVKVEHDDAAAAAWALGLPLREVLSRAEEAGRALR
jgi:hypothetical protein